MRTTLPLAVLLAMVGCTLQVPPAAPLTPTKGYAYVHGTRRVATESSCGDRAVLNDQLTTGGRPVTYWVPCWDNWDGDLAAEKPMGPWFTPPGAPERERVDVRANANADVAERAGTELKACEGLARRDVERSPFSHRTAIVEVVPHREGGEVRGARVVFKAVPGLNAAWMRRAIACQQARNTKLGDTTSVATMDPTLVEGATTTVVQHGGRIDVLVETETETAGQLALTRAQQLVAPRTARR
jgi:hypothetical protein